MLRAFLTELETTLVDGELFAYIALLTCSDINTQILDEKKKIIYAWICLR